MENNNFDNNFVDQFVISPELLKLMQWIIKHNSEGLKKVVEIAATKEFNSNKPNKKEAFADFYTENDDLQNSLIDFFSLMEIGLYEAECKFQEEQIIKKNLLPAIDHIDKTYCDQETLQSSAAIAAKKVSKDSRQAFYKELLKRWKPAKKELARN